MSLIVLNCGAIDRLLLINHWQACLELTCFLEGAFFIVFDSKTLLLGK